jgi:hypothetical protein
MSSAAPSSRASPGVPWSLVRQQEEGTSQPRDQIFSRSFAAGVWLTRGNGTVGGRSSATPAFSGSLNFDQGQNGEAPEIDFAGAGRTVPRATWYESTTGAGFGQNNVFASRFDGTQNRWVFAGQGRGTGGVGSVRSRRSTSRRTSPPRTLRWRAARRPTRPSPVRG